MSERDDLEALAILKQALLDRRADDPVYQWEPTPKQKPFIESVLYDKKPENWFIAANRCLPKGQRVLMANMTLKPIEDIKAGDRILSVALSDTRLLKWHSAGETQPATVLWAGKIGQKKIVKLNALGGNSLIASTDHRVLAAGRNGVTATWREAGEFEIEPHRGRSAWIAQPLKIRPEVETIFEPDFCRLIGYLLGDGSFRSDCVRFTNTNPIIVEDFKRCVPPQFHVRNNGHDYYVTRPRGPKFGNSLINWLRDYGLWRKKPHEKFIPSVLLCASDECIQNLLTGLFATDGMIGVGRAAYFSTSLRLMEDIRLALWRLGIHCIIRPRPKHSPNHRQSWVLEVRYAEGYNALPDIPGKPKTPRRSQSDRSGRVCDSMWHERVINIEDAGNQEVYDLEVDHPSHSFIAENFVVHNSGKSDSGAFIGSCLARFGGDPKGSYGVNIFDKPSTGLVSSLTFRMSQTVIEPKYFDNGLGAGDHKPFIPEREIAEWRVSDRILKLKNGSVIYFLSQDMGRSRYQGLSIDWAHLDEEHEENVINEIRIRIGAGRKLRIFGTATILPPEGMAGGVTWMFGKIIQPYMQGEAKTIGLFGASIYDNPYIDREVIGRLEAQYGETERRIRLGGEWIPGLAGARAYTSFDRRLHVRPQGTPFARRPLSWCLDFNVEPMVSLVGQRDGRLFRFYRELILDEGNILEMVQMFVDAFPQHYGEIWIYGDATGKKRNAQTGTTDYYMILNAMRSYGAPVRLKVPESNPLVPDRINAINRALKDERGESSIEIDPSCIELIADMEQVLRDGRGGLKKTFNRSDSYARRTHTSDAMGYWVSKEEPVRRIVDMNSYRQANVPTPKYGFTG